jgi:predicted DNA-binding transcriptional regulator AlpA
MFRHSASVFVTGLRGRLGLDDLVDTEGAARLTGMSASWLHKRRVTAPEDSPRWIKCGRRVFYRVADLRAWQDECRSGGLKSRRG